MSPRTVTPAEAQEMLDDVAANADHKCDGEVVGGDCASCDAMGDALIALRNAAPDLAATVASEPARIAAAVEAERSRICRAANDALADYLAADDALLDAIGRGEVRDEYHPLITVRMRWLEYLRGVIAPEVTP